MSVTVYDTSVKKLLEGIDLGIECGLYGWVKSHRSHGKSISFVNFNDGSTFENLQIVYKQPIDDIPVGSAIEVIGRTVLAKGNQHTYEFEASEINVLHRAEKFPIQKKDHSLEYLREISFMRHRTGIFTAVNSIKTGVYKLMTDFFHKEGFFWIQSPILTGNSCEGGAEVFSIEGGEKFFKKPALLSVSGQFHAEALALGLKKVYTFGPTFRAEKSNSSNHLAEFWMIEPEINFCNLTELMNFMEKFMKHITKGILKNYKKEIEFLSKQIPENEHLKSKLKKTARSKFKRLEYIHAVRLLSKAKYNVEFGDDLSSEHERYLSHKFKSPVFVYNYPQDIKSFYMKKIDGKVVSSVDLLVPDIGELMGGSERENSRETLEQKAHDMNISLEKLDWYLELRDHGYFSSAGFGCGFERLILYLTGLKNIKDAITYPRCYGQLEY